MFVSANVFAIVLVYVVLIEPIRGMLSERDDDLAQRRMTLARYEAVSGQEEAVQAFAKQVAESNTRGELIAGANAGIVDANLQARLKSLAEQVNVIVRSIQKLPPKNLRGVMLVGARIDVSGAIGPLHALTRALEGETPLLLVTSATLRGQSSIWNMMTPEGAGAAEPSLEAQFDVYGGALAEDHP
jgi:hypothetical protein